MNYTQCGSALALPYAAGIAQTCVTSPPYYGLRDYGTARWEGGDPLCSHALRPDGGPKQLTNAGGAGHVHRDCRCGAKRIDSQIGLEQTPAAYVAQIVAAMREVWRVLRPDGTLWLNLGSSYMASGPSGPQGQTGQRASRTFTASGLGSGAVGASGRSQSLSSSRVPAYGNDGTELPDSQGLGYACSGLCDEHLADFQSHLARIADTYQQTPQEQRQRWMKDRGIELPGCAGEFPDVLPLSVLASTTLESWRLLRGECLRCDSRASALSGFGSGVLSGLVSARNLGGTNGKTRTSRTLGGRTLGKEPLDLAWGDYTSTIKPKDMIPVPWMVAMALQADGWYLRSDIIWAKPNPMPESVTDRPTKAHEYVFLLAKQPRYFYDAEAIKEVGAGRELFGNSGAKQLSQMDRNDGDRRDMTVPETGRNARSVWNIATTPYSGAHFATMPPELARRCILAGSRPGDIVLDPFAGSGTTAMVSLQNGRRAIGTELNPAYLRLQDDRTQVTIGLGMVQA